MSDFLWPHGLQYARLPYPSLSHRIFSDSCPLSQWYRPTILACHLLLLLPSIFSSTRVFSNELANHISWTNIGASGFSISPSSEYSELISFRIEWLDLLALQETLKNLLLCYNSKASILRCSTFFMVQPSHRWRSRIINFMEAENGMLVSRGRRRREMGS